MSELTVKEMAARERVDPQTVYRWIAKGAVPVRRTPGGGIRIPAPSAQGVLILSTNSDNLPQR
jgi:excisionase family DNA binding protein